MRGLYVTEIHMMNNYNVSPLGKSGIESESLYTMRNKDIYAKFPLLYCTLIFTGVATVMVGKMDGEQYN